MNLIQSQCQNKNAIFFVGKEFLFGDSLRDTSVNGQALPTTDTH